MPTFVTHYITNLLNLRDMFQGCCAPIFNQFSLPTSPDGVDIPPSGDWRMNFLLKTSQGGISKFISWSLFFKINSFSHIVISFLFDSLLNNLGTGFNSWPVTLNRGQRLIGISGSLIWSKSLMELMFNPCGEFQ